MWEGNKIGNQVNVTNEDEYDIRGFDETLGISGQGGRFSWEHTHTHTRSTRTGTYAGT